MAIRIASAILVFSVVAFIDATSAMGQSANDVSCEDIFRDAYDQQRDLDDELVHYQQICTRQRSPDVYLYMAWHRLSRVDPSPPLDRGDLSHLRFAQTFAERARSAGNPRADELLQTIAHVRAGRSSPPVAVAKAVELSPAQRSECERIYEEAFRSRTVWDDRTLSERTRSCANKATLGWYNMWRARATLQRVTNRRDTTFQLEPVTSYDVRRTDIALEFVRVAQGLGIHDTGGVEQEIMEVKRRVETAFAEQNRSVEERQADQYVRISGNPYTAEARAAFEAAKTQDADAMFDYAERLANGDGVSEDQRAANTWLDGAASFGSTKAHAVLAQRIYSGVGNPANHSLAMYHARKAAEQGDAAGYYWRAMLAWPASSPELFMQMLGNDGLAGLMFNIIDAAADLDRAEEACGVQPYVSDLDYRQVCEAIPAARQQLLRSAGTPAEGSDGHFRDVNRRLAEQNAAETARLQELDLMNLYNATPW